MKTKNKQTNKHKNFNKPFEFIYNVHTETYLNVSVNK